MKTSTHFSRTAFSTILATLLAGSSLIASASESSNPWTNNTCSAPEYDGSMLRGDEKGSVKLRFTTDASGNVVDAKIEESSGHAKLDRASLAALKSCRFAATNSINTSASNDSKASRLVTFAWMIK
ncbi:energy transducer TonB [Undibacterium flavidum]|uniref:Energy transducer TonB n=1 Tax=Undibacterium flavidum TaxID=2762297 RepID=A0ABR6YFE0_9BURK|nr:energy transducer TonB [Undibacterium flavidum]MBC3875257.1 energy transducer TonB [Undibacterium flavidum]